jgi:hypothetical protein
MKTEAEPAKKKYRGQWNRQVVYKNGVLRPETKSCFFLLASTRQI